MLASRSNVARVRITCKHTHTHTHTDRRKTEAHKHFSRRGVVVTLGRARCCDRYRPRELGICYLRTCVCVCVWCVRARVINNNTIKRAYETYEIQEIKLRCVIARVDPPEKQKRIINVTIIIIFVSTKSYAR